MLYISKQLKRNLTLYEGCAICFKIHITICIVMGDNNEIQYIRYIYVFGITLTLDIKKNHLLIEWNVNICVKTFFGVFCGGYLYVMCVTVLNRGLEIGLCVLRNSHSFPLSPSLGHLQLLSLALAQFLPVPCW